MSLQMLNETTNCNGTIDYLWDFSSLTPRLLPVFATLKSWEKPGGIFHLGGGTSIIQGRCTFPVIIFICCTPEGMDTLAVLNTKFSHFWLS